MDWNVTCQIASALSPRCGPWNLVSGLPTASAWDKRWCAGWDCAFVSSGTEAREVRTSATGFMNQVQADGGRICGGADVARSRWIIWVDFEAASLARSSTLAMRTPDKDDDGDL